ncbi:hypothetical protein ACLOJK_000832 [Asimina triloba]
MATQFLLLLFSLFLLLASIQTTLGESPASPTTASPAKASVSLAEELPPFQPTASIRSLFYNARLMQAYFVIQRFKRTVTADPFNVTKTWRGPDICRRNDTTKYLGFYCDYLPGSRPGDPNALTVAAVDFNTFHIAAPTAAVIIQNLPDLAFFHANSNKFGGNLAVDFTKLPYFYELDVSNNIVATPFPTSVFNIPSTTFLDLRFNSFSGRIPPRLFASFNQIEVIFLNNNGFDQPIPANLGRSRVRYLTFANNRFNGSIPRSIRLANQTLTEVLFLNNLLSGCIPYEIGFLNHTTVFDVSRNRLTGPLPLSIRCMESMQQLSFAHNLLYGQIPEVVCQLPMLEAFSLANNYFTSVGPICRSLINRGVLDVSNNCILGRTDQRPPAECNAFYGGRLACANPPNARIIPCTPTTSSTTSAAADEAALAPSSSSSEADLAPAPSPSRTYAALSQHRG